MALNALITVRNDERVSAEARSGATASLNLCYKKKII